MSLRRFSVADNLMSLSELEHAWTMISTALEIMALCLHGRDWVGEGGGSYRLGHRSGSINIDYATQVYIIYDSG